MSRRRRLTILTPDFPPALGGIQRVLGELAERMAPRWDVLVVAPPHAAAQAWDARRPFTVRRTRSSWGNPTILAEMAVRGRSRTDVVLAGHIQTLPPALLVAGSRPVACMLYGSELWSPKAQRTLTVCRQRVARFIAISRFTADAAADAGIERRAIALAALGADSVHVPEDADARLAAVGLEPGATFLLTVGRLTEPHKGHDAVIRALAPLVTRHPELRYVIAGDGPLRTHVRRLAEACGVERAVVFTGDVDEETKAALLARCLALVMISREAPAAAQFEGFGLVFVEAALHGRPSIGGASGAIPDVVVHGESGLLVDPHRPDSLVAAVLELLEDPAHADALGARARARAESDLTWDAASTRIERALADLVR